MLRERLTAYREYNNGDYPDHILFYRDGISESQFGMVITQEIPQIDDAIKSMPLNYAKKPCTPKLTFLVVGKRHHSRLYPLKPKKGVPNFDAGMVVTTHVVAPKQFNFYLQSHDSALGTARPGHYVVFKNDSNYSASELQQVVRHSFPLQFEANQN